ncbi:MAG TPA: 5-(carboxyamino)imidazole ribonucleotide synthase [Verrucomicrobiae bacterium]|nr:5-(carboxyamino)imidazole ribonucleotide synthase [Verrucomicrobiae bacterium]
MQPIAQPQPVLNSMPPRRPRAACTLGIVGGGQLAKMIAQSALQFGCDIVVLERNHHSPAASLAHEKVIADWDNPESLLKLGSMVDVITLENEFVDADSLQALERFGFPLWPTAETVRVVQDKLSQKRALADAGLPVPGFADAPMKATIEAASRKFGWPLVLKKRRNGYDGKGNVTLRSASDIDAAWRQLDGDVNALYVEEFCPFTMELAMMIVRSQTGESVTYPLVETVQHNHICHVVKAPASVPDETAVRATEIARKAVETVGCVGAMGVEMFFSKDGRVLVNELAPRVHNSGHYTIEGCVCSQFENHVRAVMGWPLGSAALRSPAVVMVNLLGGGSGSGTPVGLSEALAVPGAHVHIYGKARSVPGRKMGHVTAAGKTMEGALTTAQRAAELIRFGGEK